MSPTGKKPDMSVLFGIGKKPSPEQAPPPFGGKKPMDDPAAEPQAEEQAEGDLTPDMLHYSGPEEQCAACSHFSEPSTCDRWPDPVDPQGHCEGFQGGAMGEEMGDETPDPTMEGEPTA